MKYFKVLSAVSLFTISAGKLSAQTADYKKLIASNHPGYKISHKDKDNSSDRVYLGTVRSANGEIKYYVITEFVTFRAAVVMHGNSWISFLNPQKKLIAEYRVGMPNELPYKLRDNKLYFRSAGKTDIVDISGKLPKLLCAEDCYSLQIP